MLISLCTQSLSLQCQYMCLCPQLLVKCAGLYLSTASLSLNQTVGNAELPFFPCWILASSYTKSSSSLEKWGMEEVQKVPTTSRVITQWAGIPDFWNVWVMNICLCHQQGFLPFSNGNFQHVKKPTEKIMKTAGEKTHWTNFLCGRNPVPLRLHLPLAFFFNSHNCSSIFPLQDFHFRILRV